MLPKHFQWLLITFFGFQTQVKINVLASVRLARGNFVSLLLIHKIYVRKESIQIILSILSSNNYTKPINMKFRQLYIYIRVSVPVTGPAWPRCWVEV